ncbi:hypothetical protein [Chitinophaga flava]|uniref:Class I lanthipeptide n=1 Tax=Chitinophaga flava TaxID=2259036 RepID=A0A365XPA4_9BACT|nr:hypothetical protein [Chitinophaga flava]RBL88147.1 hypothetical protein DF182_32010 [Chitinophaga flava]
MKKKQVHLKKKLILEKMVIASLVRQPEQVVGGAAFISQANTVCNTINYTVCNTVCENHACA